MNISFFLTPKANVSYLQEDCPVRQALDDMMKSGFTAIPVIDRKGRYTGTITEGDFLRLVLGSSAEALGRMTVGEMPRRIRHKSVGMDARMEDLFELVSAQNFVPVTDGRGMFCGIITRREVIRYLCNAAQKSKA